ncbi:hypothetical protein GCM10007973_01690 [Polymorphobacter multimanifer]|uniref:Type VI secretion system protein ImpA n=1 Tax=Polymorphobacter multimanifer TaxID=1070431 RepID=A0A841L930_9SPHN|nr:type VI secretion system ImpA family N-terminal domain-containing protein [Polymorphobacter multimanifer]MBB6227473.1 type VI secretion system protein ImpA [Polymorphobacter multimanifer]GGI68254.1 hypothetical protein GCM10007973_01690 [Polymorphobacter multimanifer]
MSSIDLDGLLASLDGDNPCGPDLRGEPEFRDLEDAPGEFSSLKPPELMKVVRRCTDMLMRTKDQMPAIVATQAAVRAGDIEATTALLCYVRKLAEEYWDDYHPGPAEDMAIGRINELSALARPAAMLLPLQRLGIVGLPAPSTTEFTAAVVEMALEPVPEWTSDDQEKLNARVASGAVTAVAARLARPNQDAARQLRGIMIAISDTERGRDAAAECLIPSFDADAVRPLALQLRSAVEARLVGLRGLSDEIHSLVEAFERRMSDSPSMGPILNQLKAMIGVSEAFMERFPDPAALEDIAPTEDAETAADVAGVSAPGGTQPAKRFSGDTPRSRSDVLVAIDAIVRYYSDNEPTSPVPLMLKRVRNWVEMDFYRLVEEISPNSVDEIRRLLAIRNE